MPPARFFAIAAVAAAALMPQPGSAAAEALLLVEADSGKVLFAENATHPWYPASVTKLMTAYVTLRAIKEQRIAPDTLLTVSANAVAQQPSKMGFKAGIKLTVDNALKMMMVKSANDIAVVLAEGVSGSIDGFSTEMNRAAQRLGMTQSSFVNPNGLPADGQITSARDLAILTRALIREFPEYEQLWRLPAIKFGRRVLHNHNPLIDRYPGADGMKTGFICASGFNLVATATHGNRRLIAIVLGARSSAVRTEKVLQLFEKGFAGRSLSWLVPALGTVDTLRPVDAAPPNLRDDVCGPNRHRPEAETAEEEPSPTGNSDRAAVFALLPDFRAKGAKPVLGPPVPSMPPAVVFVGPPKKPGNPEAALAKSTEPRPSARQHKSAKPALASTKSAPQQQPSHRRKPAAPASAAAPTAAPAVVPAAAPPTPAPAATPPSTSLFSPAPTIAPATASPRQ
jgi:D-alanyl-D-alanine carboxypeptidase